MKLSELKINQTCIIKSIECSNKIVSRLNDLGVVEGIKVTLVKYAPLGDPMQIKIRDYYLAIRNNLADKIEVEIC